MDDLKQALTKQTVMVLYPFARSERFQEISRMAGVQSPQTLLTYGNTRIKQNSAIKGLIVISDNVLSRGLRQHRDSRGVELIDPQEVLARLDSLKKVYKKIESPVVRDEPRLPPQVQTRPAPASSSNEESLVSGSASPPVEEGAAQEYLKFLTVVGDLTERVEELRGAKGSAISGINRRQITAFNHQIFSLTEEFLRKFVEQSAKSDPIITGWARQYLKYASDVAALKKRVEELRDEPGALISEYKKGEIRSLNGKISALKNFRMSRLRKQILARLQETDEEVPAAPVADMVDDVRQELLKQLRYGEDQANDWFTAEAIAKATGEFDGIGEEQRRKALEEKACTISEARKRADWGNHEIYFKAQVDRAKAENGGLDFSGAGENVEYTASE